VAVSVLSITVAAILAWLGPSARAQVPDISTDRPDLTESAALVPSGLWQVEAGLIRERIRNDSGEIRRLAVVDVLARAGLSEMLEARLGGGYAHQRSSDTAAASTAMGLAGIMTGVKIRLAEGASVLAHLHIPIGHEDLRLPDTAPELVFAGESALTDRVELSGNLGGVWLREEASVFASMAVGFDLTDRLGTFVEGFVLGAMHAQPRYQAECGLTYLLASNLQVDCTGGVTLFEDDPGWFLGAGLSVRIPE
jgi:hypothetical protein